MTALSQDPDLELGWTEALHPRLRGKFTRKGTVAHAGGGYTMHHRSDGHSSARISDVLHNGTKIGTIRSHSQGHVSQVGTDQTYGHPTYHHALAAVIASHKQHLARAQAPKIQAAKVRMSRKAKRRGELALQAPRGSRTKGSVASKVERAQRKRAKAFAAEAERHRELARRIVAGQGLSGRPTGRARRMPAPGAPMRGSMVRPLLTSSMQFTDAQQAVVDLVLAEAADRDLDFTAHWKHGWIPLNAEAEAIAKRLGNHAGPRAGDVVKGADGKARNVASGMIGHTDLGHGGGKGMSDAELSNHYDAHVRAADARLLELAKSHDTSRNGVAGTTDEHGKITWTKERRALHKQIVDEVFAKRSKGVPQDRHVLFLGGAPGAGKSSILRKDGAVPGHKDGQSIVINPDDFKTELAARGHLPDVAGLTPMERTAFVHEESSRMANMLAARARASGHNVTMDITMSSGKSTAKKLDEFHHAGYSSQAAFVDIPHAMSQESVIKRHKGGTIAYWKGTGGRPEQNTLGERLVPSSHVNGGKSKEGRSTSYRDAFEQVKNNFDEYRLFDNNKYAGKQIEEKSLAGGKRAKRKVQPNLKKYTEYSTVQTPAQRAKEILLVNRAVSR